MGLRTFLVVNPYSANGDTGRRWPELAPQIADGAGAFQHAFTQAPMHAAELTRRALDDGYECIVAVGGDGTINEVVNGFFRDGAVIRPNAAFGVIPRGTGGDFRRTFDWSTRLADAARRLRGDATRPIDVGCVEYTGHDGRAQARYFANICSFGVSGLVDHEVNRASKALGGKVSFMLASAKAMLKYQDQPVRLRLDGGEPKSYRITTVAVANGRYFGGGMLVAPGADVADGTFDVTIWSGYGLLDFALKSRALYDGSHVRFPGTAQLRCRELVAESDKEVLLDVDGEQPGRLPCRMTLLPKAIQLKI